MNNLTLDQLVQGIRRARHNGEVTITHKSRARITANDTTIQEGFKAIDLGAPFACNEHDRVKFVSDTHIVFVALGTKEKGDALVEHAYIIVAFKSSQPL